MEPISRFLFLLLLTLFLTFCPNHVLAAADVEDANLGLIAKACEHALYKEFCVSSLQTAVGNQQTDLLGVASTSLKLALSNATSILKEIPQLLNAATHPFIDQCLTDCSENYKDAVGQIEDSLAALDSKGYSDVNTKVTAAMSDAETCEEGFKEKPGQVSMLTDKNNLFNQLCSNALAVTNVLAGTPGI